MTSDVSPKDALLLLPMLVLPILTYLRSMLNIAGNNSLLLLAVLLIGLFAFTICISGNAVPEKLYPLALVTISFCLLFQVLWVSPYIIGWDVHIEYYLFESVKSSGHWNPPYPNMCNSALSITILPAMVQSLLVGDDTAIFKTMYPFAFSLVPVPCKRSPVIPF